MVRAFYALPVPEAAVGALIEAQARMQRRAQRSRLTVRWTRPEALHLTLKFLGWITPERVADMARLVPRHAAACRAIATSFAGVIAFGSPRRARILAAALRDDDERCAALFAGLEEDLEALGVPREERAFRPHVTLARIKRPGDVRDWIEHAGLAGDAVTFGELVLYRSRLGPDGSTYEPLARAELAG